jgi:hypothetical protein
MTHHAVMSAKDPKVKKCVDDCVKCANSCVETMSHCLHMGGKHAEASHITLMANCAEICRTSADFMLGGSEFDAEICDICAQVCGKCADSCASFGDDEQMNACADLCRTCADSCREMAKM